MRVLHCVETLHRNAGGLPTAVVEMALAQLSADRDCEVMLAGSNMPTQPPRNRALEQAQLPILQDKNAFRLLRSLGRQHHEKNFTLVHQHGLWTPISLVSWRFAKARRLPFLISPHGMLEPWARNHHAMRKKAAWQLYQKRLLNSAGALVASSEQEANELRTLGFRQNLAIIPHGVNQSTLAEKLPATNQRTVLVLSRLHAKKGIDMLLDAWADMETSNWQLVIAGMDEDGTRAKLERQAAQLGIGDRVKFAGAVFGDQKDTLYRNADLFVLPSHSENFGLVIAEAMQHGLPVVTTTGTPWQHLATEGCGWCVPPNTTELRSALSEAICLSAEDLRGMGKRARVIIERDHCWETIAESYLQLYRWLNDHDKNPRPNFLRED